MFLFGQRRQRVAFRDRYVGAVRRRFQDAVIRCTGDLDVEVAIGDVTHRVALVRAFAEYRNDPKAIDEILERWLGSFERPEYFGLEERLASIVPMLKDAAGIEGQRQAAADAGAKCFDLWYEPYNEVLYVAYAEFLRSICFIDRGNLAAFGRPVEELREIALANLRRRTPERTATVFGNGAQIIAAGGNHEAALLLDDLLFDQSGLQVRGEWIAAVPDRDTLLLADSEDPVQVFSVARAATRLIRSEPYPITDALFVRRGGRFVALDREGLDESHPIPNLDVLDVHAVRKSGRGSVLVVVIASPLDAGARSVYRLQRKIAGYLSYLRTAEYEAECGGRAELSTSTIEIRLHPGSDAAIRELLGGNAEWVEEGGARLVVEALA